jgi:hypothetical protein
MKRNLSNMNRKKDSQLQSTKPKVKGTFYGIHEISHVE